MTLTRRHYRELAEIIANHSSKNDETIHKERFVEELCAFLQYDNPKFDKEKFIQASSVKTLRE